MKYNKQDIETIIKEYKNGASANKIALKYNFNISSVNSILKRNNIKKRSGRDAYQLKFIDESFFEKIDSHDKAQILGFIYADGCIHIRSENSKRLQIGLNEQDSDYLEIIRVKMKNEVLLRHKTYHCKDGVTRNVVTFTTSNPKIISDLGNLGVGPRKSLTARFPSEKQVPKEFLHSFILGIFEGDGCIYVPLNGKRKNRAAQIHIAATIDFNKKLQQILFFQYSIKSRLVFPNKMKGKNFCILEINTLESLKKFYGLIYSDCSFKMDRKFDKFTKFFNKYDTDLKFKYNLRSTSVHGYLKSPNKIIYKFNTVTDFCKEMCINPHCISNILRKSRGTHKNWTIPSAEEISQAQINNTLIIKNYRIRE